MQPNVPSTPEWFQRVCQSYTAPPVEHHGHPLPAFPPDELQIGTTGQAGIPTLHEGFVFYGDCVNTCRDIGAPLEASHRILDFGVGWGRIARFFLRDCPLDHIYGIDVDPTFIQICRDCFRSDNFTICRPVPPTSFLNDQFDLIVGYSVFSHLSESACMVWMEEFSRILRPGGVLALTTRSRDFLAYCETLGERDPSIHYHVALSTMFEDFDEARRRYDNGNFVHSNNSGLNSDEVRTADFYGETFIPEQYARTAYSQWFEFETFLYAPERQSHPILFFRKR